MTLILIFGIISKIDRIICDKDIIRSFSIIFKYINYKYFYIMAVYFLTDNLQVAI